MAFKIGHRALEIEGLFHHGLDGLNSHKWCQIQIAWHCAAFVVFANPNLRIA
jgi:hypothetical protein